MAENNDVSRSTPAFRLWWDVFLSFRGDDTRHGITNLLYTELERKGVRVFRDNDMLNHGDEINSGLHEGIEDSAAAIAIISPNYASSGWCLEELATICDCGRLILPVFYLVDPLDVRHQRGPFESGFRDLESRFKEHEVRRWRNAMAKTGGRRGWVLQNKKELRGCQVCKLDPLIIKPWGALAAVRMMRHRKPLLLVSPLWQTIQQQVEEVDVIFEFACVAKRLKMEQSHCP